MKDLPDHFGPDVATRYDEDEATMFTAEAVDPAVEVLAGFAGDHGALEFAIGTGRVALPLSARSVRVVGIDLSEAMLAELRAKPGADAIPTTLGDIATTRVAGEFDLVYLVFNTILNLTTQDQQVACFVNAAAHLGPGGRFVVEVVVPQLQRLSPGQSAVPFEFRPGKIGIDEYDIAGQGLVSHHWTFEGDGRVRENSTPFRYVWPAELDLMARIAGMQREHRWADWHRRPFTSESPSHVSVWRRPA